MFKRSLFQFSFIVFMMSLGSSAFALDFGTVTAVRDRSKTNQVLLEINFTSVTASDSSTLGVTTQSTSEVQQAMANHLDICLPTGTQTACGETDKKVLWSLGRLPTAQTGIYISTTQTAVFPNNGTVVTTDTQDTTIHSYKIQILITDTAAEIPVGQKIFLRLYPEKLSANGNKDKLDIVAKLGSGVADALTNPAAYSTAKALIAAWTNVTSVKLMDGTTGTPNGVYAVLLPRVNDAASIGIPALTYSADPAVAPTSGTCSVVPAGLDTDTPTCSVTCAPEGTYTLDTNGIAAAGISSTTTTNLSEASVGFSNLSIENGPYAIVLEYLPEGTAFSCVIGTPSDAGLLTQLGGGPSPKSGDPSCFIATAAYGSALDPHIDVLRWFRDTYLLKTSWGQSFVRSYYKNSPPVAAWIKDHEWARTVTRGILWAPVVALENFRDHFVSFIALVIVLALGAVILLRRRFV